VRCVGQRAGGQDERRNQPRQAGRQAELAEPRDRSPGVAAAGEVGERLAVLEREAHAQPVGGEVGIAAGQSPPALRGEQLEALGVDRLRRDGEPEPPDANSTISRAWAHRAAGVEQEQREQHSHPRAADLDRLTVVPDRERPEDAKPHGTKCGRPGPGGR
jgi:hypothetical protein